MSSPSQFTYFTYKQLFGKSPTILFVWNQPVFSNGPIEYYVLLKDSRPIYQGLNLFFIDNSTLLPYIVYEYQVKACNLIGCVFNENIMLVCTKQKLPEKWSSPSLSYNATSMQILWQLPMRPNGIIEKCAFSIEQLALEYFIQFSFKSNLTKIDFSAKSDFTRTIVLAAESKEKLFNFTIRDLDPYTYYSYNLVCCNGAGSIQLN